MLKRCVDVDDLLATATSGQADVAVVGLDAPGLDPSAVTHLRRYAVRPVAVAAAAVDDLDVRARAERLGITRPRRRRRLGLAGRGGLDGGGRRRHAGDAARLRRPPSPPRSTDEHRIVAVWGPGGAPGRTTVAVSVAAELRAAGTRTVLVDADPYGGGVAQQLGILDEVSGLLSAVRLAGAGQLGDRFASTMRARRRPPDGRHRPAAGRPVDRGPRGSPGVGARSRSELGDVIVDTGFSLEDEPGGRLRRAARAQRDDLDRACPRPTRSSWSDPRTRWACRGWHAAWWTCARSPGERRSAWSSTGCAPAWAGRSARSPAWSRASPACSGLHFLPDDRAATDRALVAGRSLVEGGDGQLRARPRRGGGRASPGVAAPVRSRDAAACGGDSPDFDDSPTRQFVRATKMVPLGNNP